jgi:hypothetical protein
MTDLRRNLIIDCREEINSLPKLPDDSPYDWHIKHEFAKFKIAEKYLLKHQDLIANDCCGRGLPSYRYAFYSRVNGFKMNAELEKRILEIKYLRINALGLEK